MTLQRLFRGTLRWLSLLGIVLITASQSCSSEDQPKFLTDTNYFGKDIRDFDLPEESPRLCYRACVDEKTCHAFTYLRPYGWPGAGAAAHCWLKYAVPGDVRPERCCVSGVVRPGEDPPPPAPPPPPSPPKPREPEPLPSIRTTEVKLYANRAAYKGACPASIEFRGVITAPGRGSVTYAFTQGKEINDVHQLEFRSAGTREVKTTIEAGTSGGTVEVRETLRILDHIYCGIGRCPPWITEKWAEAVATVQCR